jgi:hypothetical protein
MLLLVTPRNSGKLSRTVERDYNFNLDSEFGGLNETSHLTTYGVTKHRTQYGAEDLQWTIHISLYRVRTKKPIRKNASSYKMIFLRINGKLKRTKQAYKRQMFHTETTFASHIQKMSGGKNTLRVFDQKVENVED